MVYCTHKDTAQSIFFWNIACRQAISPVAKFHHVLGRGVMIQRVILIFVQMSHSQSELTILHESMIYSKDDQGSVYKNCKFHDPLGRGSCARALAFSSL